VTTLTELPFTAVLTIAPVPLTPPPKAVGTVPVTGSFNNDFARYSGPSGSDDRAGCTHTAPEVAGTVPAAESFSNDFDRTSDSSDPDDRASSTHTAPRSRGDGPRNRVLQ
jgi:hypothetical protein